MRLAERLKDGIRANCAYCQYASEVKDFMCRCSNEVLKINYPRSVGYRKCSEFNIDRAKYENTTL